MIEDATSNPTSTDPQTSNAPPVAKRADRLRAALAAIGAAVLGAAPHVLHHVGPLAGAALFAGATGGLLFGALGFVLVIPMLRRIRRHTGSWRVPGVVLALMVAIFTFSTLVIGPALTGGESTPASETQRAPGASGSPDHDIHHK